MLKQGPSRWLLALLIVSATAAVLVAGPVVAGPGAGSKKVIKKVVKANTGIFNASNPSGGLTGGTIVQAPPLVGLTLPKGNYAVTAKVTLQAISGSGSAICAILLDGFRSPDTASIELSSAGPDPQNAAVPLQAAFGLNGQSRIDLRCIAPTSGVNYTFGSAKLQAIRGPTLTGVNNTLN